MTSASTPRSTGLVVDGLSVQAGGRRIVEQVSFSARPREVTVVIGPNGAGKTSLLEAVVGLRPAASGSLQIDGQPLAGFRAYAQTCAYLPDQAEIAAEVSGRTLVEHALGHASGRAPSSELRRLLAIEPLLARGAGVLSRGERQRVLLFCALVLGRRVVVLDEPFSSFDPLQLQSVLRAVRCVTDAGAVVVASVHQLSDAEQIADRVLILREGRALAFGTLAELRAEAGDARSGLREVFLALLARSSDAA